MAKALMIQGTGSGVGKSLIVTGLCRILKDMGIKVSPFKAQNMALNSFITKEGGEIGRAQALQAEAAGVEPCNDMNPILLKASGESGCQVILNGKVYGNMKARDYYAFRDDAWRVVTAAYDRLSQEYDVIVIEGAGSPAEINLQDIVNMRVAYYTDAPVILVGDIDRGGVFASFYGTIKLLKDISNPPIPPFLKGGKGGLCDADYIKAFIVNKFRGDIEILRPGLRIIEEKTHKPVIGVIPYHDTARLHEEDGLALEGVKGLMTQGFNASMIKIVIVRLRYISNFTDFDPFLYEPDVELIYSNNSSDILGADLIIIPGSKNTVSDLLYMRESGVGECVKYVAKKGTPLIGICGGYQMLGKRIFDPFGVESTYKEVEGFGLLDIETTIEKTKITSQVEASVVHDRFPFAVTDNGGKSQLRGYEVHMGVSRGDIGLFKLLRLTPHDSQFRVVMDGSAKGNVWGTYIHGLFDNDEFRTALLNSLREKRGLPQRRKTSSYSAHKEEAINKWADILRNNVDICFILRLLDRGYSEKYHFKGKS